MTIHSAARATGGRMFLRIEDIDSTRVRPEHERSVREDLEWLGIDWDGPVRRQSDHLKDYDAVLRSLAARDLIFPCSCTRSEIAAAGARPGADGLVYPGTCRGRPMQDAAPGDALRLDLARSIDAVGILRDFTETGPLHAGRHKISSDRLMNEIGDPVLKRRMTGDPAYHLACTHDDALQNITHVIRGDDLWQTTPLHVLLQQLLGWQTPIYHHHDLIRDEAGRRLAKVDRSKALSRYRADGATPADIRAMIGFDPSAS